MADETSTVTRLIRIVGQVAGFDQIRKAAAELNDMAKNLRATVPGFKDLGGGAKQANSSLEGFNAALKQSINRAAELPIRMAQIKAEMDRLTAAGKQNSAEFQGNARIYRSLVDEQNKIQKAMKGTAGGFTAVRGAAQNVSFQLTDMVVSFQNGQKAATIFTQQVPQLLAAFGPAGAIAGVFATIAGAIAGPLIESVFGATKKTEELRDALTGIGKLDPWPKKSDFDDVAKTIKEAAVEMKGLAASAYVARSQMQLLSLVKLRESLRDPVNDAGEGIGFFTRMINGAIVGINNFLSPLGTLSDAQATLTETTNVYGSRVANLAKDLGVAAEAIVMVRNATNKLNQASSASEASAVYTELADVVARFGGGKENKFADFVKGITDNLTTFLQASKSGTEGVQALIDGLNGFSRGDDKNAAKLAEELARLKIELRELQSPMTNVERVQAEMAAGLVSAKDAAAPLRLEIARIKDATDELAAADKRRATVAQVLIEIEREQAARDAEAAAATEAYNRKLEYQSRTLEELGKPMLAFNRSVEELNALRDELNARGLPLSDEAYAARLKQIQETFDKATGAVDSVTKSIFKMNREGLEGLIDLMFKADQSFAQFASNFLREMAKMIAKQAIFNALKGSPVGKFFGLAKGGAFSSSTGLPFGIYDRPTFFNMPGNGPLKRFANGGVLGEAGPEAILPLRRGANGKLGVETNLNISVINNVPGAGIRTSRRDDGGLNIEVIEQALASKVRRGGSVLSGALQGTYGLNRAAGATS